MNAPGSRNSGRTGAGVALQTMVLAVLLIQIWLVSIAAEANQAANHTMALPCFVASLACLAVNIVLLKLLTDLGKGDHKDG